MDKLLRFMDTIPGWLQPIGFSFSIICFIAAAILMQTGEAGASKSKKWIGYIVISIAIIALAASLVTSIRGAAE
jgi:type IV secretory pathway VirB2 component (pilin)